MGYVLPFSCFFIGWPLTLSLQWYEQCLHVWTSNWQTCIPMSILILKRFKVQHVDKIINHWIVNWCIWVTQNIPEHLWIQQQYTSTNKVISYWVCFLYCECFRVKNDNLYCQSKYLSYFSLSLISTIFIYIYEYVYFD